LVDSKLYGIKVMTNLAVIQIQTSERDYRITRRSLENFYLGSHNQNIIILVATSIY